MPMLNLAWFDFACCGSLSLAVSLVGDSKIVFLDEPTTGLDPATRRHIWSIIARTKKGRAIILTTHSMVFNDEIWCWSVYHIMMALVGRGRDALQYDRHLGPRHAALSRLAATPPLHAR